MPRFISSSALDLKRTLSWITDALGRRGHDDVKITTLPIARVLHGHGSLTGPSDVAGHAKAYLCLRGTPGRTRSLLETWQTEDADVDAALDYLLEWALALPGAEATAHLSLGHGYSPTHIDYLPSTMTAHLRRHDPVWRPMASAIIYAGHRFRATSVCPDAGIATFNEGHEIGSDFDWRPAVEATTAALAGAGDWCAYGHITRCFGTEVNARDPQHGSLQAYPLLQPGHDRERPERLPLTDGYLFDAYGIMRLPSEVAADLPLNAWDTQPLPDESVLARHHNLGAWFDHPAVDRETLLQARALLTKRMLEHRSERNQWAWWQAHWADHERRGWRPPNYWTR